MTFVRFGDENGSREFSWHAAAASVLRVSDPVGPRFCRTGIAFLAVYLAFNMLTECPEFDGLGITLWSPDNGLSLALLIDSAAFAPFVFLGAILIDLFIAGPLLDRRYGFDKKAHADVTARMIVIIRSTPLFNLRMM